MSSFTNKRLNLTTTDGLLVLSAKIHQGSKIAKLLITDLENKGHIWVDIKNEVFISGVIKLQELDVQRICKEIKNQELSFDEKLFLALATDL